MSNTKLYSMAERVGFWQSLMNKFRGKKEDKKPEGRSLKEREMLAADESIQNKVSQLESFFKSAKTNLDQGDLQACYNDLFNYSSVLHGLLDDAAELIEFGVKHKISSKFINLRKIASLASDESSIKFFRSHFEKFLNTTEHSSLKHIKDLISKLDEPRNSGNVSGYISVLRKIKDKIEEEASGFSEKLAHFNESVVLRHKNFLYQKKQENKDVRDTLKEMAEELKTGPKPLPDVSPPSSLVQKMQDIESYLTTVRPESSSGKSNYLPIQERYPYGVPASMDNKPLELTAKSKQLALVSFGSKMQNKYGG